MAYLELTLPDAQAEVRSPGPAATLADFSAVEWRVIRLARRDPPSSIGRPGRIGTLLRRLAGLPAATPLADPRLETLRGAAVSLWHSSRVIEPDQVDALLAAGFSFAQVALLAQVCTPGD